MGKLIDSDWLKEQWVEPTNWMDGDQVLHHYTWFKMVLELAPTVDAVPLDVEMWEDRFNIQTRTWRTKDGETEAKSFIITRREQKDG